MNRKELERFFIFCILSPNKPAKRMWQITDLLLQNAINESPLEYIKLLVDIDGLVKILKSLRTGQYTRLAKTFEYVSKHPIDLWACSVEELEAIPGIGPKTARFFLMRTRSSVKYAALDTHILKWMRNMGFPNIPKNTPTGKQYREIEKLFIELCDEAGISPVDADQLIWSKFAV